MKWVDTHCHLQLDGRDPRELIARATEVGWMVVPGIDADSSRAAIELAGVHPDKVFPTAGLHPHSADGWREEGEQLVELAHRAVAIGETGLDFYRDLSPRDDQISSFRAQVDLAMDLDKPLVVHCRDAFSDVYQILESTGAGDRAVLHSWTGGTRWTKRFLDLGVMFSFSGTVAFETAETIRLGAELIPPDRALVEYVGAALAGVWGVPVGQVAEATSENAARVFR